ncbi:DUF5683 domain-containing protein [Albibacterium profundi]|uniref:DUF5683 domain-containing protein n=1 Tax=Albibacterium profundi TaxID=3134906 RepID=A0ABV5CEA0_9SPHI
MRYGLAFFVLLVFSMADLQAQTPDSLRQEAVERISADTLNMQDTTNLPTDENVKKSKTKKVKEEEPFVYKDSTRLALERMTRVAVTRSAIIPGWGQLTNKRWWKVPIIYGGIVGLVLTYDFNQTNYKEMLSEAQYRITHNGQYLHEEYARANQEWVIQAKDFYRRNRDLTILVGLGLYALNLVDAYVDAKMFRYDIDDDLSFRIDPFVQQSGLYASSTPTFGFKLAVTIP